MPPAERGLNRRQRRGRGAKRRDVTLIPRFIEGDRRERLEGAFADHERDAGWQWSTSARSSGVRAWIARRPAVRVGGKFPRGGHRLGGCLGANSSTPATGLEQRHAVGVGVAPGVLSRNWSPAFPF